MKRRLLLIAAAIVPLSGAALAPMAANAVSDLTTSSASSAKTSCSTLPVAAPPGAVVESVTVVTDGRVASPSVTPRRHVAPELPRPHGPGA
jgi:hypothetical protein